MLIGVLPCGACGFILTESLTPHQSFSPSLGDLYREELYQISFGVMSAQWQGLAYRAGFRSE